MPSLGPEEIVDLLRREAQLPRGEMGMGLRCAQLYFEVRSDPCAFVAIVRVYLSDVGHLLQERFANDSSLAVGSDQPNCLQRVFRAVGEVVIQDSAVVVLTDGLQITACA